MFTVLYWACVVGLLVADRHEKWDAWGKHPTAWGTIAYLVITGVIWLIAVIALHARRAARRELRAQYPAYTEPTANPYGGVNTGPGGGPPGMPQQAPRPVWGPPAAPAAPVTAGHNALVNTQGTTAANLATNQGGEASTAGYRP